MTEEEAVANFKEAWLILNEASLELGKFGVKADFLRVIPSTAAAGTMRKFNGPRLEEDVHYNYFTFKITKEFRL